MKFKAKFSGKEKGAIGISSHVECDIEAESYEAAELELYKSYEHIHMLTLNGKARINNYK